MPLSNLSRVSCCSQNKILTVVQKGTAYTLVLVSLFSHLLLPQLQPHWPSPFSHTKLFLTSENLPTMFACLVPSPTPPSHLHMVSSFSCFCSQFKLLFRWAVPTSLSKLGPNILLPHTLSVYCFVVVIVRSPAFEHKTQQGFWSAWLVAVPLIPTRSLAHSRCSRTIC